MGMHWHMLEDMEDEEYARSTPDRVLAFRMFKYVLHYRRRFLLMLVTVIVYTLLSLAPPLLFQIAIDQSITFHDMAGLYLIASAFIVASVVTFVTQSSQNYLIEWLGVKMEYDMRMDIFRRFQKLSLRYYAEKEIGSIVSRATNDIDKIAELIATGLVSVIADLLTLIGVIVIMFWMNQWLSLITFSVIPMIVVFMLFWGQRVRKVYRETRKTIASVSAQMEQGVSGMKEIQSYSKEGTTRQQFQQVNISNMEANVEAGRVMSAFWPVIAIFTAIGQCLVLWFGGVSVIEGALTIGVLFAFMSYVTRFFQPIQDLSMFWNSVQSALAASERVFKVLDTKIDIEDSPEAYEIGTIEGRIIYDNVTFGYKDKQPVLSNINLVIEPNTTVALVGPTGAGKTTMVNLLYRFYDPIEGRITVDGHDLRAVKIESLRNKMGIVLQDPFLFSGTIMENIRYGRPDANDDEVIAVSRAIGAHEFIEKLPDGYMTDVKERGSRLSVGQRQLVSLARALLANPRILIMDEATSSIDAYTELIIQKAMERVLMNRTAIIIAHRLSTVRNADQIVVLDEGQVEEIGTHRELIRKEGIYRRLYEMQFKTRSEIQRPNIVDEAVKIVDHE